MSGERREASGERRAASGEWRAASGERRAPSAVHRGADTYRIDTGVDMYRIDTDRIGTWRVTRPRAFVGLSPGRLGPLGAWGAGGHEWGAIAGVDGDRPIGLHIESPLLGVEPIVVVAAEGDEVRQIGTTALLPTMNVVGFGDRDVPAATRDGAGAIHGA